MVLFAFPGSDRLAAFGVKCLAVAGGFLAGYVLGGIAAWALDKWAFAKKSPNALKKAVRILAGIALALLIAFIVFGTGAGGGWLGGNGGAGAGTNPPNPDAGAKSEPTKPAEPQPQPKSIPAPEPDNAEAIAVMFLGGDDVQGDRFYRLDGSAPMSFEQLKAAIARRQETAKRPLKLERRFSSDPGKKISKDSINVRQVEAWAESQGIKTP